jgi:SNF2 family DNA or RNA helicase
VRTGVSGRLNSIVLEGLLRMRQACVDCSLLPTSLNTAAPFVSTKLKQALAYTKRFKNEGHKVLIFSQFVGVLHRMESLCADNEIVFENLYGDTTDRRTPVEKFQNDDNISVFLISLKAGGVGLNLTAADRIILLDDWWNPAVEDQAFARAHRIGQNNDVEIYRIICRDTVEEKLLKLQEKKRQTIDIFNSTSSKLTYEELKELIF